LPAPARIFKLNQTDSGLAPEEKFTPENRVLRGIDNMAAKL
jgi:hypothetical protein